MLFFYDLATVDGTNHPHSNKVLVNITITGKLPIKICYY